MRANRSIMVAIWMIQIPPAVSSGLGKKFSGSFQARNGEELDAGCPLNRLRVGRCGQTLRDGDGRVSDAL